MPRVRITACRSETMHGQPHPLNFLRLAPCSEKPELPTAIQSDFREQMLVCLLMQRDICISLTNVAATHSLLHKINARGGDALK